MKKHLFVMIAALSFAGNAMADNSWEPCDGVHGYYSCLATEAFSGLVLSGATIAVTGASGALAGSGAFTVATMVQYVLDLTLAATYGRSSALRMSKEDAKEYALNNSAEPSVALKEAIETVREIAVQNHIVAFEQVSDRDIALGIVASNAI